jgi:ferric-dicitrate binding protein FerR (iron transport regulator)
VDVEHVVAWKNGRISFQGADIGTVMRQMSRWYDVDIEYNEKMNDLFYADISRSTMLSDVLKALELTTEVHFKIEGRKVTVVP